MTPEPEHDCLQYLQYREHSWVETHGLDAPPYEACWQEWWECAVCGSRFTSKELREIYESQTTVGRGFDDED